MQPCMADECAQKLSPFRLFEIIFIDLSQFKYSSNINNYLAIKQTHTLDLVSSIITMTILFIRILDIKCFGILYNFLNNENAYLN